MGIFVYFMFTAQGQIFSFRNKEKEHLEGAENQLSCNLISTLEHTLNYQWWFTDMIGEISKYIFSVCNIYICI